MSSMTPRKVLFRFSPHPKLQRRTFRVAIHQHRLADIPRMVRLVRQAQHCLLPWAHRLFGIVHLQAAARSDDIMDDQKLVARVL